MRRVWLAICVAATAGCADLLSLDDAVNSSEDADADGARDTTDNCKGLANPDQADTDHDGIGDACDLLACPDGVGFSINRDLDKDGIDDGCDDCRYGPPDDEDADGVADACDVCPAIKDAAQVDLDDDGVGDACDQATGSAQSRIFFDGFGSGSHGWVDPTWTVAGGALNRIKGSEFLSVNNQVIYGEWYVQVGLDLPATGEQYDLAFIVFDDFNNHTHCGVYYDTPLGKYVLSASLEPRPQGGFFTGTKMYDPGAHITLRAASKGTNSLSCTVVETNESLATSLPSDTAEVLLRANSPDFRFTHVELVR